VVLSSEEKKASQKVLFAVFAPLRDPSVRVFVTGEANSWTVILHQSVVSSSSEHQCFNDFFKGFLCGLRAFA
jgi:hypothetical protein